jgi:hypothetical protein
LLWKIIFGRGWGIRLLLPPAAEFYIKTGVDSLILRSKINESTPVLNYYLARSAEKILFTQPQIAFPGQRSVKQLPLL